MAGLNPKHLKALSLIEENTGLSTSEIAKACGFSTNYLHKLIEAHPDAGPVGQLFRTSLNRVYENISKRVKKNTKSTQDVLIKKLRKWSEALPADKMNAEHVKKACDILHALAKSTPRVEIGSISITKHFSPQEIINEYKRLTALARFTLEGHGVSSPAEGGARELYRSLASGSTLSEEQEASLLPAESEAGDVPQE